MLFSNSESPNTLWTASDPWVAQVSSLLYAFIDLWYRIYRIIIHADHAPWFSNIRCNFSHMLVFYLVLPRFTSSFCGRRYFGVFVMAQSCFALLLSVLLVSGLAAWSYLEEAGLGFKKRTHFKMSLLWDYEKLEKVMTFLELLIPCWSYDTSSWMSLQRSWMEFLVVFSQSRSFRPPVWVCKLLGTSSVSLSGPETLRDPETWSDLTEADADLNGSYDIIWIWISHLSYPIHIQFISNSYPIHIQFISDLPSNSIGSIVLGDEPWAIFSDEVMMAAGVVGVWVRMKIIWVAVLARKKRECAWFKSCVFVPWQRESLWVRELHRANWCQDNS